MPSLLLDFAESQLQHQCGPGSNQETRKPLSEMPMSYPSSPSAVDADFTQVCFSPEPTDELCTSSHLGQPAQRTFHLFSAKAAVLIDVSSLHLGEWKEPWTRSWRTWIRFLASLGQLSSGSWDHDAHLPTSQGCWEVQMRQHMSTLLKTLM